MFRLLSAASLIAASLVAAPAFAQHHHDYRAQYAPYAYEGGYQNNYADIPAFTQGCPPGSIPESFPTGNGRRCALPGGGYFY